ncbi:MAG: hypothetical protein A2158_03870 [Chloroflexi bacterium RBG_13_46_14]|nr:MAG: hypothetical protein A2158_03870 [Chloroflexi bacterium RBG_13_46_14]
MEEILHCVQNDGSGFVLRQASFDKLRTNGIKRKLVMTMGMDSRLRGNDMWGRPDEIGTPLNNL